MAGTNTSYVPNPSRARLDERIPSRLTPELEPEGDYSIPPPTGLDNAWMQRAACLHHEPELFFPPGPSAVDHIAQAQAICRGCPVARECLEVALADPTLLGVWGGTSETQRAAIRRTGRSGRSAGRSRRDQGLVWIST
jgi:WhiB family transcriptional regulator, redox-sensing transcriptional regulator